MTILLVTPMQQELDLFARSVASRGIQGKEGATGRLPFLRYPQLDLILARGGTGKPQFALQTQHLLDYHRDATLVICAGAAGALDGQLAVGDLVVATTTVEHDRREGFENLPLPSFPGSTAALAALQTLSLENHHFRLFFGPVASGDEDIVGQDRREEIREATGALAVAWEGAGGARACHFSRVPYLEIRGISDGADENAATDFSTNLERVLANIAYLLIAWLG